ncbi:hypothetical protein [Marinoscillum sp. MHG1-6]|uniref:hypothetical protein n=1 Tax=Marinoscillum sp. MHG1-6 TaxID=2959627 RepID=UPI0021585632|nr:hypothetical protein [Marinoscillum sp. MHG1-6]
MILVLVLPSLVFSQGKNDQREEIYVNLNSTTVLSGETLLFSVFCRSMETGKASVASKIAYVELVGEEGVVFQKKIALKEGRGYGDYFVPSTLKTGTYQLVAYTLWMRNFQDYFQSPVIVVNPFDPYQNPESDQGVQIKFYSGSSQLVKQVESSIGYHIESDGTKIVKGKVVDDEGEVLSFVPDERGFGCLTFVPKNNSTHKAILEDETGQFHFFDLPPVLALGTVLSLKESAESLDVEVQTRPTNNGTYNLRVLNEQNLLKSESLRANDRIHFRKSDFQDRLLFFLLLDASGDTLALKTYINHQKGSEENDIMKVFGVGEPVSMHIDLKEGTYSVSVRKYTSELCSYAIKAIDNQKFRVLRDKAELLHDAGFIIDKPYLADLISQKGITRDQTSVRYLPEYRSELIYGRVTDAEGNGVNSETVFLSLVGPYGEIQTSITKSEGYFVVPVNNTSQSNRAYVGLVDNTADYSVRIEHKFLRSYPRFNYRGPVFDSLAIAQIVERSVNNQLENLYYRAKKDSLIEHPEMAGQLTYDKIYNLDDYTRFENIDITFTELVPMVNYRKDRTPVFGFMMTKSSSLLNQDPLVLLDGLPVDGAKLMDYALSRVARIGLVNNRQYLGPAVFDGVVSLETYDMNLPDFKPDSSVCLIELAGISPNKDYYHPSLSDLTSEENLPDNREQLLWIPIYEPDGDMAINFRTSKIKGTFELTINGYTNNGEPVSLTERFKVQ